MSGGPPHHPHNRQVPPANTAWNHLQVPNFFPRPQHAHMSNEHPLLHQPTWHTPTTEPLKNPIQHSHLFNLEQMLSDRPFPRHSPGVDLSVTRNGNQNGDLPTTPISLSVRDTNKINSLAASALDIQATELKSLSPGLKSHSPGLKSSSPGLKQPPSPGLKTASPGLKSTSPGLLKSVSPSLKAPSPGLTTSSAVLEKQQATPLTVKKAKRVDSILERLNPQNNEEKNLALDQDKSVLSSVVQTSSSHDENSNSSSILNVPTPSTIREDEVVSPYSNEDSLDSNKSRRKRKPSKTVRVPKDDIEPPKALILEDIKEAPAEVEIEKKIPERRKSESPEPANRKPRRKTSSESETIDKIAEMVQQIQKKPEEQLPKVEDIAEETKPETASIPALITPAQKKDFVAVEDKLEEMFAGLEDPKTPSHVLEEAKSDFQVSTQELLNLENTPSTSHDNVTSTSTDVGTRKPIQKKRKMTLKRFEGKKKKNVKRAKIDVSKKVSNLRKVNGKAKLETIKDIYAYDSGSNASSSKSRGPFVQIRGPRDSPLSVSVVNTPVNEEDVERKGNKTKKFHDDSEYRHKVRSKGLHCSTLSNKYDAQTKDVSWICVFCKRGPYSAEFSKADTFYTPGDLFGPYVISNNCLEFEMRLDDPHDRQFKSKKVCRTLEAITPKPKKSKRKNSEGDERDSIQGIMAMDEGNFEIWAHEDCIVWSPGIYLVGPKIVGLEEAVWTCSNVSCTRCHLKGANICCLKRGCASIVHLGCAYILNWQLDEDNYKAYCIEHQTV